MKKILAGLMLSGLLIGFAPVAFAATPPTYTDLENQLIALLEEELASLKQQLADLLAQQQSAIPASSPAISIQVTVPTVGSEPSSVSSGTVTVNPDSLTPSSANTVPVIPSPAPSNSPVVATPTPVPTPAQRFDVYIQNPPPNKNACEPSGTFMSTNETKASKGACSPQDIGLYFQTLGSFVPSTGVSPIATTAKIYYSTSMDFSNPQEIDDNTLTDQHTLPLSDFPANQKVWFKIVATDSDGHVGTYDWGGGNYILWYQ